MHMKREANVIGMLVLVSAFCGFFVHCGLLNQEQPIAQVGDAKLTRTELELIVAQIGPEEDYMNAQRKFVYDWVDRELLYREAQQQNIKHTQFMKAELERVSQNMLMNLFLKIQIDSIIYVSDDEIREHFDAHSLEFTAESDYYKFEAIKTADAAFAGQLENTLKTGSNLESIYSDAPEKCQIVSNGLDYLSAKLINPAIAKGLQKQKNNKNFSKYTLNGEVYFIRVLGIVPQGEIKPFAMVTKAIRQQLLHIKRQKKYTDLISRLRKNYSYEINLNIQLDSVERR